MSNCVAIFSNSADCMLGKLLLLLPCSLSHVKVMTKQNEQEDTGYYVLKKKVAK